MVVLFPVGIPVIAGALLYKNRDAIINFLKQREKLSNTKEEVVTKADEQDLGGGAQLIGRFKGLFLPFKPECYWWGVVDISNRLLLTGFAVVFEPGTMMQVFLALHSP